MRTTLRRIADKLFTGWAGLSVVLMAGALVLILAMIFWRGSQAVVFRGTVEWRELQLKRYGRGDADEVEAETRAAREAREKLYEIVDRFGRGLDPERLEERADHVYRQYKQQVRNRIDAGRLDRDAYVPLRKQADAVRDDLVAAYYATDAREAQRRLEQVLAREDDPAFTDTVAEGFFRLAREYREVTEQVDLSRRQEYAKAYTEVADLLRELLGPREGDSPSQLERLNYGATRWDQAQAVVHRLLWVETWVPQGPGQPLKKTLTPRREQFEGTPMVRAFDLLETDLDAMLRPHWTFYWHYFTDGTNPEGAIGGAGPQIVGTFLLAGVAIAFAFPLGLVAAAFLVECTRGGPFVRLLRMCINTLAGVPSIVFGLFGLAAILMWFQPKVLGWDTHPTVLAGGLTLGLMVLPIIIRASEEAIRAVPQSYREASLALGAGKLRTFLTVTFPAALPGVLTGVILSLGRAAGETAPILFTAAVLTRGNPWDISLGEPTVALPYSAYMLSTTDRLAAKTGHLTWGMIMTLVMLVLVLNLAAIIIRSKVSKRLRGG
jgi:phosphate transport system permease protein